MSPEFEWHSIFAEEKTIDHYKVDQRKHSNKYLPPVDHHFTSGKVSHKAKFGKSGLYSKLEQDFD